jgi:anti-sigma B factor antagonist
VEVVAAAAVASEIARIDCGAQKALIERCAMSSAPALAVIAPEGEIDLHSSPQLKAQFDAMVAAPNPRILVDLSGVSYMDSSGLAVLIEAMQRAQSANGWFALSGLRDSVRTVFTIARLDQVFRIFPDREDAERAAASE